MMRFASVNVCRRKQLLEYFNEKYDIKQYDSFFSYKINLLIDELLFENISSKYLYIYELLQDHADKKRINHIKENLFNLCDQWGYYNNITIYTTFDQLYNKKHQK